MSPRLRRPLFTHSLLVFCIGLHLVSLQNSLWPFAADNDEVTVLAYSRVRELCHLESWFPSPRPPTISSQRLKQLWDSHHYTVPPPPNSDQNAPQVPQGRDLTYETSQVKLSLHVFAWKRAKSLNRLLTSLLKADYSSQSFVDMFIHIDGRPTDAVLEVIDGFSWPFGELIMKRNTRNIGLKKVCP